jgi:hypothetical protein
VALVVRRAAERVGIPDRRSLVLLHVTVAPQASQRRHRLSAARRLANCDGARLDFRNLRADRPSWDRPVSCLV